MKLDRFRSNEVRLRLSVIDYNLGNLWRRLVPAEEDQQLVADEFAAKAGEDRRPAGEARPLLLVAAGGCSNCINPKAARW